MKSLLSSLAFYERNKDCNQLICFFAQRNQFFRWHNIRFDEQLKPVQAFVQFLQPPVILLTKSALDFARNASRKCAPTEVPDRMSCRAITCPSSVFGIARQSRIIRKAYFFVRFLKSSPTIAVFFHHSTFIIHHFSINPNKSAEQFEHRLRFKRGKRGVLRIEFERNAYRSPRMLIIHRLEHQHHGNSNGGGDLNDRSIYGNQIFAGGNLLREFHKSGNVTR